ncbi:MAG: A/G-specific adenine glycosylase [Bacteroidota bacterium]|nr:A/G-specific adenine glycosylase [Bacteroidota bacterium]
MFLTAHSEINSLSFSQISGKLLLWYSRNKRILPWRMTRNPYQIWISEIILQQTRINQGLDYYLHFLEKFPDVETLAAAQEEQVLKAWQGLGYYSRARNLYKAAKQIMTEYNGRFPDSYKEICNLKGIGPYTSAAIASIAFNQPYPVVDGNVIRFLSRLFRIKTSSSEAETRKYIYELAGKLMADQPPGEFNQAMMEFGALACKPIVPLCGECTFREYCLALKYGETDRLPVKKKSIERRDRYFHYLVILINTGVGKTGILLRKRIKDDIWKNLFDFLLIETDTPDILENYSERAEWSGLLNQIPERKFRITRMYKQVLSHQNIYYRFYIIRTGKKILTSFPIVDTLDLESYPLPRPIEKFLEKLLK